jgi:hypothetical protein
MIEHFLTDSFRLSNDHFPFHYLPTFYSDRNEPILTIYALLSSPGKLSIDWLAPCPAQTRIVEQPLWRKSALLTMSQSGSYILVRLFSPKTISAIIKVNQTDFFAFSLIAHT